MNAAAILALLAALIISLILNVELWRRATAYRIQRDDARGKFKWLVLYAATGAATILYLRRKRD